MSGKTTYQFIIIGINTDNQNIFPWRFIKDTTLNNMQYKILYLESFMHKIDV